MSLFPIFKVNKLTDKNTTDTIYVFCGSQFSEESNDPNELFQNEPTNKLFGNIFDKDELTNIKKNNIDVVFVEQTIHIDDSIGVIKLKIFEAIHKEASINELYLFCLKSEKLNPITVYQNLTQNDKLALTKVRMNQMILNLYDTNGIPLELDLEEKPQYTFDDILKLDLTVRDYLVGKPLGQKFVFSNEYPFISDPFMVQQYDTLLERSRREVTTLNANLLLEMGPIFRNSIYLCLAQDVFELAATNEISTEYTSKIYYPFLYKDNIDTTDKLEKERTTLIESTSEKLTPNVERNFENVDMFYNIFQHQEPSEKFSENLRQTGIKFFKIIIYPEFHIKIPIDVIFKLIHATEEFPMIKYNPETKQENIYRLFAPELTVDGRKIPYLSKANIIKLMKMIGKNKSIAVYTNIKFKGIDYFMSCEFEENGNITIYPLTDFDSPILLSGADNMFEDIDNLIGLTVNPLIEQIKTFFEQSGLDIPLFTSIQSSNIEVREMKYYTVYNITKPIDINKYSGCLSSIFTVESSNIKKGIQMRYKRVSNFNKRESQEAFIIEKIDQGLKLDDIIAELLQQYDDLDEEMANDLIIKIRSELEVIRGANKRRALMIKINPGFQTVMNVNLITSELIVTINGINDIYYLNTIPIYINTIVRITQDIESTTVDSSLINKLCFDEEIEDIDFGEIVAQSEQNITENEVPILQDDSPVYSKENENESAEQGENMDELLDMLGFEDEDEENFEGGIGSNSSESVRSEILSDSNDSKPINTKKETKEVVSELGSELDSLSELGSISDGSDNKLNKEASIEEPKSKEEEKEEKVEEEKVEEEKVEEEKVEEEEEEIIKETNKPPTIEVEEEIKKSSKIDLPQLEEVEIIPEKNIDIIPKKPKQSVKPKVTVEGKIKETKQNLENTVRDITGMNLKYPNPFSARLEERMPQLFVKSKDEKFDLYTRMCPFSLSNRRQPVILTKSEKDKIVSEHPGDIDPEADFIEYGTDAKDSSKKFYYTCPRYWCLLTNTMVTEQDILDGKCGPKVSKVEDAIIPKKDDVVPKGKYVYKFYDEDEKKYPGFHKQKTESGLCIPCCYSNWSTTEMKNRRDICQGKFDEITAEPVSEKEKQLEEELKRDTTEVEHYVKGPEKYGPQLGEHRWGFLPISVQKFLHEVNEDCQMSKTNMNLKLNHMCILRHGVENSQNQSFIACIASAIFYGQKDEITKNPLIAKFIPNAIHEVPTIKEMKQIIINSIDIDKFMKYQNGDLITSFADSSIVIHMEDYKDSQLYKKFESNKKRNPLKEEEDKEFMERAAQSFENFKNFLKDDKITIDYTYLWDLISMPNPLLFDAGINLIILEIPEDDATNNIDLVCPTNHYSVHAFDARKRSLILIKRENYFEPVYGYRNDGKRIFITKTFTEYDKKLPKTLRSVFAKIIKPTLGEKCRAFVSRPLEYRFKQAPVLDKLLEELIDKKYKVTVQILNFQGKVIGVLAKNKKGMEGFIPCYPSSLTTLKQSKNKKSCDIDSNTCEYDYVFMNDSIWKSYEQTLEFLKVYYDYEEPKDITKANCFNPKYFCRVVEQELITGFLTNSNQFVPIKDPIPVSNVPDTIKTITNNDMLVADINTLTNNQVDSERVDFIKKIQLETNFYNVFRNTIRILFNDYSNSELRKKIQEECNKKYSLYKVQLDKVIELLHDLVSDTIVFVSVKDGYNYKDINENDIHTCISTKKENCNRKDTVCRITNDKCTLVLPKNNLVNGTDNETFYYARMVDELLRYNRIKSFIFKPQAYLSFGQVKYNLRDNEIIILQDLLNQEFFENLIPAEINRYSKYNTFDTAEPIISQTYRKEVDLDEIINPSHIRDCVKSESQPIKSGYWKTCFPKNYKEVEYLGSNYCSLYLIIDLLEEFKNKKITIEEIKNDLILEYSNLTDKFTNKDRIDKIIDILKEEAQFDANQLEDETMNFEQMIIQDGFIAINFDLWLLLVRYEIPSIFISSKNIPETRYNFHEFTCYTDENTNKYAFIVVPAMYRRSLNDIPKYRIVVNENDKFDISLDKLEKSECLSNIENAIDKYISIEDYLDVIFERDITTKYKPRQKGMREIELVEINTEPEIIEKTNIIEKENPIEEIVPITKSNVTKSKGKKINSKLVLKEAEEVVEEIPEEIIDIEPVKKRKPKTQKVKVNPLGKTKSKTKKILSENIEIIGDTEIIN